MAELDVPAYLRHCEVRVGTCVRVCTREKCTCWCGSVCACGALEARGGAAALRVSVRTCVQCSRNLHELLLVNVCL